MNKDLIIKGYEMKKKGNKLKDIMKELGLNSNDKNEYKNFSQNLIRFEKKKKEENIIFEDKKSEYTEMDVYEYYESLKNLEKSTESMDQKQTTANIEIKDEKPIAISFWGDWHLGAKGLNYKQFDIDRKLIAQTEGLYVIGMGDYKDNASAFIHKNNNDSVAPQHLQDILVKTMWEEVGSHTLALIRGCHSQWDKKLADKDLIQDICDSINAVNMWHGGTINIKLGNETYKFFVRHKYKNESGLNTTNVQRNMLNDMGPCDVCALGHKHYPDMQMLDRMGQKVVYLRSGSYKKYDEFGQQLAGYEGKKSVPTVVIFPDSHKIVPFQEIEDAVIYLNAVRK